MPQPLSVRSLLGDARFDLDEMLSILQDAVDEYHHADRLRNLKIAHVNRLRVQIDEAVSKAQSALAEEQVWDGTPRRRTDRIVAVMNDAAEAELAWTPTEVAA